MTASPDDLARTPLLTPEGAATIARLREHEDAPRWNYAVGDRLVAEDLPALDRFREALAAGQGPREATPPPAVLEALERARARVPRLRWLLPPGLDLARDFAAIPTSARRDLAAAPWEFVPEDAPLERLVVYRTAGTTGHPIEVPHHPRAVACYLPLLERALARHGARLAFDAEATACFLLSAQVRTYTYATVLAAWGGAGFAKVNLRASEWPREGSAARYVRAFAPRLLTGEPVAFAEALALGLGLEARPVALVSSSVALGPALAARLRGAFGCPVLDWYSLVETGPLAVSCPRGAGHHVLPHDVHVEVVRDDGSPAPDGERGEVAVTGGRNPLLPLVRYRTGDHARLERAPCACGDPMPRLVDLEGRAPVLFRASDGTPVGAVDVSRCLREFPLLQHAFRQRADRSCALEVRPLPGAPVDLAAIERAVSALLGGLPLEVRLDARLGEDGEKVVPYATELDEGGIQ